MKAIKNIKKKYSDSEIAESLVFPMPGGQKLREQILSEYRINRKQRDDKADPADLLIAQLLQLRFLIEDYVQTESSKTPFYFGYFLNAYILCLHKKKIEFAKEINVNPTELSQVINKHRKPTDKLIYRLDIHSNSNFPAQTWFRILEKDRYFELSRNPIILEREKKYVKKRLTFTL